jgi:diacylglycerol kinase
MILKAFSYISKSILCQKKLSNSNLDKNDVNKFNKQFWIGHKYDPIKKIKVVSSGFWFVFTKDFSVTYKVVISVIVLILSLFYNSFFDFLIILIATGYMLSMEIMNSSIELLCDFQETGYNYKIKVIKDVASVAAGISIIVWLVVIGYEIYQLWSMRMSTIIILIMLLTTFLIAKFIGKIIFKKN